jgi:hypothetical protein
MKHSLLKIVACTLLFVLFAAPGRTTSAQQPPQQRTPPCKTQPEYRQFDFWVGEWDVQTPQGQQAGTNSVQLILGDCVLLENWTGARGGTGKSFNVYNAAKGKWQQTWVDNVGGVLELLGEYKDDKMSFTGETKGRDGSVTLERLTFTKISADRVRQFWEQSRDGGKTWTVAFDGTYIRRKTPAAGGRATPPGAGHE